ncbi:MAG: ABC transporter ATP-binding protein [bacterium]|nr:ABC transporter ATP-binding protein [bacterium]
MDPVIELDGLSVHFGQLRALQNLKGAFSSRAIGLLGPNGAGKTTLIHTLLGFHKPVAGTARVFGNDVRHQDKAARALIGYMPERDSFIAGMTAVRFIRMMAELSGVPAANALERAHEALFYVGLGESRYRKLEEYSQGMKQRAKLAQALVHGPRLLFLDEATNGLDPPARERMIELIREIRDTGEVHVVLSSHLLGDVEECCEDVMILKEGEIVYNCNLEEERRTNRKFLELELSGSGEEYIQAVRRLGCECAPHTKRRLKMVLPPEMEIRELYRLAAEQQVEIRHLDYKKDSLQDIFLKAMNGKPAGSERSGAMEGGHGGL